MTTPRKKIKVKDAPALVRDSFSKAIINVDRNNYASAKARKKMLLEKDVRISTLESEVELLKKNHDELVKLIKSINKKA